MLEVLLKKAKGYEVFETTQEYTVDEEGNKRLLKEKVAKKNVAPDLSAIKTYMELADGELMNMSDEELKKEKKRLIGALKKSTNRKKTIKTKKGEIDGNEDK